MHPANSLYSIKSRGLWRSLNGFVCGLVISGVVLIHGMAGFQFILSWLIATLVGVCLHELGHAVACKLAGGTVQYVQLGWRSGEDKPWEVRFAGFNWHLYSLPFSGRTHGLISSAENYRMRQCFFIAGGPLSNLALLIPGAIFLKLMQDNAWTGLVAGWVGGNIVLLLVSVIPKTYRMHGNPMANDGLLFWQTLHYADEDIENHVKYAELFHFTDVESAATESLTLAELLTLHQAEPANIAYLQPLVNKLHLMDDNRYPDFVLKLIEMPGLETARIAEIIDACLTWQLHRGPPDRPDSTDHLSGQLLELADSVTARGTRGSILIDLGRTEEGQTMLHEVLAKTNSAIDKSYANIFLALAEKQLGNFKMARAYAQTAEAIDPGCPALKRVADLLN